MTDPLRRRVRARALRVATQVAGSLPQGIVRRGLDSLAWCSRFTRHEERTRANLDIAFGDELDAREKARIASEVRGHSARIFHEWMRLARATDREKAWLAEMVEFDDSLEILREQSACGRGVIVATAHIGNWEFLAASLVQQGFHGAVVGLERRRDPTSRWLIDMRRAHGVTTIAQDENPRALVRVLQDGGTLGLLCDLEVRRLAGEFLPFFGEPALTMTAPAALARARRLPLLPIRCVLPFPGAPRYRLSVEPPLVRDESLPRAEATAELMGRVNAVFERWVRESPGQWAWHQARWRTRPGEIEATPIGARRGPGGP